MTPCKAWESIAGIIRTADDAYLQVQAIHPPLDWIRAACTCAENPMDHALISKPPKLSAPPPVSLLDQAVLASSLTFQALC